MIQSPFYWVTLLFAATVYWLVPLAARAWVLAIASIAYLATLDIVVTITLLIWVGAFYYLSRLALTKNYRFGWLVPFLIISVLCYLAYFKYLPVILHAIGPGQEGEILRLVVPLGISYFTFKLIHYAIEMRRSTMPPHGYGDFLSYCFMFPIYTAGPIERFDHFLRNRAETLEKSHVLDGCSRISHGLIKKFVIGGIVLIFLRDQYAAESVGWLLDNLDAISPFRVWLFVIVTYLIIYMDFSAYSDIAIGSSRFFGIHIMENFNFPIIASNIGNFWKRWHMTLAGWCQSYVYMPTIGITRNPYFAVIATFTAIGIWHGASLLWLFWGLYHAVGVIAYLSWIRWRRKSRREPLKGLAINTISTAGTFLFVSASFAFTSVYGHGDAYDALGIIAKLFWISLP